MVASGKASPPPLQGHNWTICRLTAFTLNPEGLMHKAVSQLEIQGRKDGHTHLRAWTDGAGHRLASSGWSLMVQVQLKVGRERTQETGP